MALGHSRSLRGYCWSRGTQRLGNAGQTPKLKNNIPSPYFLLGKGLTCSKPRNWSSSLVSGVFFKVVAMKAGSWVFSIRLVHTTLSFTCTYSVYALSGCSNAPKKGTDWVNERMDARLIAQGRRHPICIRVPPAPHLHHHCSRCEEMSNRELLGVGTEPLVAPFPNVP